MKQIKLQASQRQLAGVGSEHDDDVRSRLESYRSYVESERGRLEEKLTEADRRIQDVMSELGDVRSAAASSLDNPSEAESIDDMRRKLAETSIQLEE